MARIGIIDYGAGNLDSVRRAVYRAGEEAEMLADADAVRMVDRVILPGVGAAGEALARLRKSGMDAALTEFVERGRPFLGICLGMQMLAGRIDEFGEHMGFGWIEGEVVPVKELATDPIRVPHMGWNQVDVLDRTTELFHNVRKPCEFYFAHSNTLRLPDKSECLAATTSYGVDLVAAVQFGTVFATQFHPEKSQLNGDHLIGNFLDWHP